MGTNSSDGMKIHFEDREDYLYTFFSGKREGISDTIKYWQYAIEECKKRAYKKLLVEQEFPIALSTIDSFDAVEAVTKMQPLGLIIAFVDRESSHKETNMFVETVAINRGMWAKVFNNFHEGETWLKSQPAD